MIKVTIINRFFMQISIILHMTQRIRELISGSERVKNCNILSIAFYHQNEIFVINKRPFHH